MRYVLAAIRAIRAEWQIAHPWTCPLDADCGFTNDLHRPHTHHDVPGMRAIGYKRSSDFDLRTPRAMPRFNTRSPFDPVDEDEALIVHGEEVFNVTKTQQAGARLLDTVGTKEISRLVEMAGVYEVNWLITEILNRRYPADIFGDDRIESGTMYGVNWGGEHGGSEIDPGVRWVALLRHAVRQIPE